MSKDFAPKNKNVLLMRADSFTHTNNDSGLNHKGADREEQRFFFFGTSFRLLSFNVSQHEADKLTRRSSVENSTFTSEAVFILF